MSNNNNYDDNRWNLLFQSIWRNLYLNVSIFNHVRKYKLNECVVFKERNNLRNYADRSYIKKIIYKSRQALEYGDLPMYGELKEIEFTKIELSLTPGEFIPFGVEILTYSKFYGIYTNKTKKTLKTTPFSTLPSTLHTINNAIILLPENASTTSDSIGGTTSDADYIIPENIKSIKINNLPKITKCDGERSDKPYLKIPNTIKCLEFQNLNIKNGFNSNVKLRKGDLPEGITNLSILGYRWNKEIGIIPTTVKELKVSLGRNIYPEIDPNLTELESLFINLGYNQGHMISPKSNFTKLTKLKKLTIILSYWTGILNNSLPLSLEELNLHKTNSRGTLSDKFIPNSVSKLSLSEQLFLANQKSNSFEIPETVKSLTRISRKPTEFEKYLINNNIHI